jgi:peptidoglycan/LPS O-acetylase OafA/YrhL
MYLVQQPILSWMRVHIDLLEFMSPLLRRALFGSAILLTSYLFWIVIERPARSRIMRLARVT